VVAIDDGDTLTLLVDGREQVKVRLAEIDTPEKRQPYGNKARRPLLHSLSTKMRVSFGRRRIVTLG
jgi:endonuclease YncB( thermonuclease family)